MMTIIDLLERTDRRVSPVDPDFTRGFIRALRWQIWRTRYFPYRLMTFEEGPTCERSWNWRGRQLHARHAPNPFYPWDDGE